MHEDFTKASRDATHLAIGRFVDDFAGIEFLMRYCLCEAVGLNLKYMDAVITHDFALLCTAVTTVYADILNEEDRKELKRLISKCREMNDRRVKVAHGHWIADYMGGIVTHVSRQTLRGQDTEKVTELLGKRSEESAGLFADLNILLMKHKVDKDNE